MAVEATLMHLVSTYLAAHLPGNAQFFAERMVEMAPAEPAHHLALAECRLRCGSAAGAVAALQAVPRHSPHTRYLLAALLAEAGQLADSRRALMAGVTEAAAAAALVAPLSGVTAAGGPTALVATCASLPGGASGLYLLGRLAHASGQMDAAAAYLRASLTADPFLVVASELLSRMGRPVDDAAFRLPLAGLPHQLVAAPVAAAPVAVATGGGAPLTSVAGMKRPLSELESTPPDAPLPTAAAAVAAAGGGGGGGSDGGGDSRSAALVHMQHSCAATAGAAAPTGGPAGAGTVDGDASLLITPANAGGATAALGARWQPPPVQVITTEDPSC